MIITNSNEIHGRGWQRWTENIKDILDMKMPWNRRTDDGRRDCLGDCDETNILQRISYAVMNDQHNYSQKPHTFGRQPGGHVFKSALRLGYLKKKKSDSALKLATRKCSGG